VEISEWETEANDVQKSVYNILVVCLALSVQGCREIGTTPGAELMAEAAENRLPAEIVQARELLVSSAIQGSVDAKFLLAAFLSHMSPPDHEQAELLYLDLSFQGHAPSMQMLSEISFIGRGGQRSDREAAAWAILHARYSGCSIFEFSILSRIGAEEIEAGRAVADDLSTFVVSDRIDGEVQKARPPES
jgi:hypothetical protein